MLIGIDFDNTIVCYDSVFHRAAIEMGWLEPATEYRGKGWVRDTLRAQGMEEEWIHLQGHVYGPGMSFAAPFPGVKAFFGECRARGVATCVISHRTRHPYRGPAHDLHEAARRWLAEQGFAGGAGGSGDGRVFFELTKEEKLARIAATGCTHFIDDLPELLGAPGWPDAVERLLFDPEARHADAPSYRRVVSWDEAQSRLLG